MAKTVEGTFLRRLFSTFAPGAPGAGLLLLRVAAGGALFAHAATALRSDLVAGTLVPSVLAIAVGVLLVAGLWTPIAGTTTALLGVWDSVSQPGDPWSFVLLAAIGAALTLLGPGAWSVDAKLFGWRRIDVHNRKS